MLVVLVLSVGVEYWLGRGKVYFRAAIVTAAIHAHDEVRFVAWCRVYDGWFTLLYVP